LYNIFSDMVRILLIESQCKTRGLAIPGWIQSKLDRKSQIHSNKPLQKTMIPDSTLLYSEWDSEGIPIRDNMGRELSKSARKKIQKRIAMQTKGALPSPKVAASSSSSSISPKFPDIPLNNNTHMVPLLDFSLLDPKFCTVVIGTFGARQGLEFSSHMGPFCHIVQV
jgi:hypothetical protein